MFKFHMMVKCMIIVYTSVGTISLCKHMKGILATLKNFIVGDV